MKSRSGTRRVGIALNRSLKAVRDEIQGILAYAAKRPDWEVRILDRSMTGADFHRYAKAWRMDGLILDDRSHERFERFLPKTCNLVYIDTWRKNRHSVELTNRTIAEAAANLFLKRHYSGYAFVGTDDRFAAPHAKERLEAFSRRIAAGGFPVHTFTLATTDARKLADEPDRLADWVRSLPKPCGLLICSDLYARTVYDACRRARIAIPDQIAPIGVDNEIEIDENLNPPLSSILPDFTGAGAAAAAILDRLFNARKAPRRRLVTKYGVKGVFERASTRDNRGDGRLTALARDTIRENALSGLTVEAIAKRMNVSRRLLELRFKAATGHSVLEEIMEIRLGEVTRRLKETDQSIESIALTCGWKTPTALQILFKRRFGVSMSAYRSVRA